MRYGNKTTKYIKYDDGQKEDRQLVEIFNRYGMRGTWNLNSSHRGATHDPELQALYAGHEVAAHGLTHPWYADL